MILKIGKIKINADFFLNTIYSRSNILFLFSQALKLFRVYNEYSFKRNIRSFFVDRLDYYKIRKHFYSAGIAGAFISASIHGQSKESKINRQDYSLLFSYWAGLLISLDSYFDLKKNEIAKDISANFKIAILLKDILVSKGVLIPSGSLIDFNIWITDNNSSDLPIDNDYSSITKEIYFLESFANKLANCLNHAENEIIVTKNLIQIIDSFMKLMTGQINSLNQIYYSECYNWNWYSKNVLEQKFNFIFPSVLWSFPQNKTQYNLVSNLIQGMKEIDTVFIHRQILDDLIDFGEDIDNGILATPSYILLAIDENTVMDISIFNGFLQKILKNITLSKKYRKGMFYEAYRNKNKELCKEIIVQSGILESYFEIVEDEKKCSDAIYKIKKIVKENPSISDCLYIYFNKTIKSYNELKKKYS